VRQIEQFLIVGVGVDGRHQPALDCESVVQNFGNWRKAVGCARGIGDDVMLRGIITFIVNADANGEVFAFRGSGNQDFLDASPHVLFRIFGIRKQTRRFDNNFNAQARPVNLPGIAFLEHPDAFAIDLDTVFSMSDIGLQISQHGVVFQ